MDNNKSLENYMYKGQNVPVCSNGYITLSKRGMELFYTYGFPYAMLKKCWIDEHGQINYMYKCRNTFGVWVEYTTKEIPDVLIEENCLDYQKADVLNLMKFPNDEAILHLKMKAIVDGTYDESSYNKNPKPLFKDWEIPELMLGWVAFIIFFLAVAIFKDWYIKLILRIVVGWYFGLWRQQKVYGVK